MCVIYRNQDQSTIDPGSKKTVKVLRVLRVLRPLKAINKAKKLKVLFHPHWLSCSWFQFVCDFCQNTHHILWRQTSETALLDVSGEWLRSSAENKPIKSAMQILSNDNSPRSPPHSVQFGLIPRRKIWLLSIISLLLESLICFILWRYRDLICASLLFPVLVC